MIKKVLFFIFFVLTLSVFAGDRVNIKKNENVFEIDVVSSTHSFKKLRYIPDTTKYLLIASLEGKVVYKTGFFLYPEVYEMADSLLVGQTVIPENIKYDNLEVVKNIDGETPEISIFNSFSTSYVSNLMMASPTYNVEKVIDNGDDLNRVVFVILGEGYTESELDKFNADTEKFIKVIFNTEPWLSYQKTVNIYRVDVISNESGGDHPNLNPPVFVDTALDATYNGRLLTVNTSKAYGIANLVPGHDQTLVIVNDNVYGGSGGSIVVSSTAATGVLIHELGHSFAKLADEYTTPYPGYPGGDHEPNVSYAYEFKKENIKWNLWIDSLTPLPTNGTGHNSEVGMFEGARYKTTDIYRPTVSCAMRTINVPFCQVCSESHITNIYSKISIVDSYSPLEKDVSVHSPTQFSVNTLELDTIEATWSLNDTELSTEKCSGGICSFTLNPFAESSGGPSIFKATISDVTEKVRKDQFHLLTKEIIWNVSSDGAVVDNDSVSGEEPDFDFDEESNDLSTTDANMDNNYDDTLDYDITDMEAEFEEDVTFDSGLPDVYTEEEGIDDSYKASDNGNDIFDIDFFDNKTDNTQSLDADSVEILDMESTLEENELFDDNYKSITSGCGCSLI